MNVVNVLNVLNVVNAVNVVNVVNVVNLVNVGNLDNVVNVVNVVNVLYVVYVVNLGNVPFMSKTIHIDPIASLMSLNISIMVKFDSLKKQCEHNVRVGGMRGPNQYLIVFPIKNG